MISRRFPSLILIATVLTGLLSGVCRAAPSKYDYVIASAVMQVESALTRERARPGSASATLDNLSRSLPESVTVKGTDGSVIRTDLSWVKSEVSYAHRLKGKKRIERLQDLLARLRTLQDASGVRLSAGSASTKQARDTLAKILAGKEYRRSLEENLAQRIFAAIARFLSRVLTPGTGEVIGWILLVGLVLGAAALLVFLALHLIESRSPKKARVKPTTMRQARIERPTTEMLLQQAEADARAGRFREAFRSIYLAAILHLDSRRFVTYQDGTTNWEYTRSARRLAPSGTADVFCDMTRCFDDLIYGQKAVTGDEYAVFRNRLGELEETH